MGRSFCPLTKFSFLLTFSLSIGVCVAQPSISQVTVIAHDGNIVLVRVDGSNLLPGTGLRTTPFKNYCHGPSDVLNDSIVFPSPNVGFLKINKTKQTDLFLCVGANHTSFWLHQGEQSLVPADSSLLDDSKINAISSAGFRHAERNLHEWIRTSGTSGTNFPIENEGSAKVESSENSKSRLSGSSVTKLLGRSKRHVENNENDRTRDEWIGIKLFGMRVEAEGSEFKDGVVVLLAHSTVTLRLFGDNLSEQTFLAFTPFLEESGSICEFPSSEYFQVNNDSVGSRSAEVKVNVPGPSLSGDVYYLCLKDGANGATGKQWRHQGNVPWLQFRVYEKLIPPWATAIFIALLLCFSALFSGLTLGLMSLDKTDLKILCNTGKALERQYAAAIMPVRSHGSLLLCSLLLGNVLVNSVLTILMDELTSGVVAVIFSTLAIVIFGEIMPQAICSRHGLAVGAKTIYLTKFVIILTAIVAWPISKILDYMLGEEIGNVYNRERLNELVKTGTDIEKDEVNIISGALELSNKTVASVMTKLEDVFMLSCDALLDFETVSEIMNSGYSRIPVYEGERSNIVTLLFIKDLAFVDPDDNTPLKTLCEFYQNSCYFVFEDMTLDVLFKKFKEGSVGHMAFVQRVNAEGEGDPFYETLGLITLEDVIEELIQAEIVDETDVWTDNRSKRKREKLAKSKDFAAFAEKREHQRIHISPHLTLATFQYLSTTVESFKAPGISATILQRLLQQDIYRHIRAKNKDRDLVYQQGKAADYFVLILEGRVEVLVGKENMRFESGPFTYFGVQALLPLALAGAGESPTSGVPASVTGSMQSVASEATRHAFIPDYTVRATTELFYVLIKRSLYLAARRATLLEQCQKAGDHFDDEVDKLLQIEDDERSQQGSRQSSRRESRCGKESPKNTQDLSPANGILPTKPSPDLGDAEERTKLLTSAVS